MVEPLPNGVGFTIKFTGCVLIKSRGAVDRPDASEQLNWSGGRGYWPRGPCMTPPEPAVYFEGEVLQQRCRIYDTANETQAIVGITYTTMLVME
jgi:hypothetical protein